MAAKKQSPSPEIQEETSPMIFSFQVNEIGRNDKTTGKIVFHGRSKGGLLMIASVIVPIDELANYHIDDSFVLRPEGTPIEKV